jgi:hypothetical protein
VVVVVTLAVVAVVADIELLLELLAVARLLNQVYF